MNKGKFGISPVAIAAVAFILVALNQPVLLFLVVGVAVIAETDEWLKKQALQALYLSLTYYIVDFIAGWAFRAVIRFFSLLDVGSAFSTLQTIFNGLLTIALLVFAIIGLVKVLMGKDAGLPGLATLADRSMGIARPKPPVYRPQQQYAAPRQPYTAPAAQPSTPQPTPAQQPMAAPAPSADGWVCTACGRENKGKFCSGCGAKNANF